MLDVMTSEPNPERAEPSGPRAVPALMAATFEAATTDPDPLAALGATRALAGLLSTWEAQLAAEAVAAGATWESIGGSVGVSRQAAWERFHAHVHDHLREFRHEIRAEARALRDRQRHERDEFRDSVRNRAEGHRRHRR